MLAADLAPDLAGVMDAIVDRISFGVGRKNAEPIDHPVLDAIRGADFAPQRGLLEMAAQQLGTVGSGNHYVDLFEGDDGYVWVGVHFGSRGFGHRTASGFLALAQGKAFGDHATEGEIDSPPILFGVDGELGQSYIAAMHLAGDYAYAGRDTVVAKVLEILGAESTYEVHNHHNFAWRENHAEVGVWVVRKGCTPAFPGQEGFVGATMGEPSVILRGVDSEASATCSTAPCTAPGGSCRARRRRPRAAGGGRARGAGAIGSKARASTRRAGALPEVRQPQGGQAHGAADARRHQLAQGAGDHQRSGHRVARRRRRRGARRLQAPG